jgi:DNA repair exonuclease SbcCD ATPase subunit
MKFLRLEIKNYQPHEELTFEFPGGLHLVDGWNYDLDSANGTGKSAFINSIPFSIYGKTPKNMTLAQLVRRGAKNLFTEVSLDINGDEIKIQRSRSPNFVKLFINSQEQEGTTKEIEIKIINVVGLTYDQFVQVVYIYQNATDRFINLNDTKKKEFLTTILSLEAYSAAYKIAHKNLTNTDLELSNIEGKIFSYQEQISDLETRRNQYNRDLLTFNEEKSEKVSGWNAEAKIIKAEIVKLEKQQAAKTDQTKLQELRRKQTENTIKQDKIQKARNLDTQAFNEEHRLNKELQKLNNLLENPPADCKVCGQQLPNWGGEQEVWKSNILAQIENINIQIQQSKKLRTELDPIFELEGPLNAELESIREQIAAEKADGPEQYDSKIALEQQKLKNIAQQFEDLGKQENILRQNVDGAEKQIFDAMEILEGFSVDDKNLKESKQYLLEAKKIFSPTGIRAFVFDSIIDDLNARLSYYLNVLFNGLLQFEFVSEDKNGKFAEECTYGGRVVVKESLSGGEFRRLSIGVDLALSDVICNRMSIYPNILLLDEATEGLDQVGRETMMTLLQDLSVTKDSIYVIDHASEFKTSFNSVIKFEKRNGLSKILDQI